MVKISTVIQIIFAEKFVSQDFTIRAAPGLSGPTNTCAGRFGELQCLHWTPVSAVECDIIYIIVSAQRK